MDQFDAFKAMGEFWTRAGAGFFAPGAAPGFSWPTPPQTDLAGLATAQGHLAQAWASATALSQTLTASLQGGAGAADPKPPPSRRRNDSSARRSSVRDSTPSPLASSAAKRASTLRANAASSATKARTVEPSRITTLMAALACLGAAAAAGELGESEERFGLVRCGCLVPGRGLLWGMFILSWRPGRRLGEAPSPLIFWVPGVVSDHWCDPTCASSGSCPFRMPISKLAHLTQSRPLFMKRLIISTKPICGLAWQC